MLILDSSECESDKNKYMYSNISNVSSAGAQKVVKEIYRIDQLSQGMGEFKLRMHSMIETLVSSEMKLYRKLRELFSSNMKKKNEMQWVTYRTAEGEATATTGAERACFKIIWSTWWTDP